MKIRVAALSAFFAAAAAGGALADVVKGPDLFATGRIVSTGNASMVLQTDDHGHMIPFMVGTTTDMPPGAVPGSRVTVHYHPIGTDRQMADQVVLLEESRVASAALGPQAASGAPERPSDQELPRTASPLPLVGLAGLAAFLGSVLLRRLERGR